MKRFLTLVFALLLVLAGCSTESNQDKAKKETESKTLTVSAAASLTDVSKALEKEFKKKHPNTNIKFNYGGSGSLRKQVEAGADVDVLMSANTSDVDKLQDSKKVKEVYDYAKNKLIIIKYENSSIKNIKDVSAPNKVAIGEEKSVPAGRYAVEYLKKEDLYNGMTSTFVFAKDVKQVLNYVQKENAEAGFVYATDMYKGKDKKVDNVVKLADAPLDHPIIYRAGLVTDKKEAKEWFEFLKSKESKEILKEYHFEG
ncbi:molybdate ABC transporter substrate-binding protein [Mammaliicoccus sciuri]|uniref:molybdate ABC transporter substrate-binding protein n=1 Tax=Mammaliicoccus sciuri TaxID=1296 RepID=UPI002B2602E6|nr:molybdate ABC transporter substrate-binding protein [Mammaliicoccus sciuri]WQK61199.1 molybdate ABC transporter substrate-binding protein [Mammaliicoccus sciuri]